MTCQRLCWQPVLRGSIAASSSAPNARRRRRRRDDEIVSGSWQGPSRIPPTGIQQQQGRRLVSSRIIVCSATPRQKSIKVVVNGLASPLGKEAIRAVSQARGMQLAGAVDRLFLGQDAGAFAGLEEPLELPVVDDLVMVLGSVAQSRAMGVMVDFSQSSAAYENVRQAAAFGLSSVVVGEALDEKQLNDLLEFCEKASTGCVVAPTLSIGAALLQQAAEVMAFHYSSIEIVESESPFSPGAAARRYGPSPQACSIAAAVSGMGRTYNENAPAAAETPARGQVVGDGVRVHSLRLPGLLSSVDVRFSSPGEILSLRHDVSGEVAYTKGLLLAIRRAVKLKALVYGLGKLL